MMCGGVKSIKKRQDHEQLADKNMETCYNEEYEDGQERDQKNQYYDAFIEGCVNADNTKEICVSATDAQMNLSLPQLHSSDSSDGSCSNHLILYTSFAMIAINVRAGGPRLILVMMLQEKKVIASDGYGYSRTIQQRQRSRFRT